MHEMAVSGEIKTIAAREGSSGIFTGSIEGLYQGYRFGSTVPDEREYTIEAPNGTIVLLLRQQIVTPLPSRPKEHPFANGKDPFENQGEFMAKLFGGHGGPPPGVGAGGPPPGVTGGGPPGGPPPGMHDEAPGVEGGQEIFKRVHYMEAKLHVVPEKSTGIFAGATAEMEIMAPNYEMAGYTLVETKNGQLRLDFLEAGSRELLKAKLWVNGDESTGMWKNARGDLEFALTVTPPVFGRGPYSGTIWLENPPPS